MGINSEPERNAGKHENVNGVSSEFSAKPDSLRIVDNRTGKEYTVPIVHNAIPAMAFREMKAPSDPDAPCDQTEYGIRVYDPGFQNTAVSESSIAYKYRDLLLKGKQD